MHPLCTLMTTVRLIVTPAVVLAAAACATARPPAGPAPPAPPLGRDFVTDYQQLTSVTFLDGENKRWVIQPRSVSIFDGTRLRQVIDARAGLEGSIVAAEAAAGRLWLGTTEGAFALDMRYDDLQSFADLSSPVDDHIVAIDARDDGVWMVTRTGVISIDAQFDLRQTYPLERAILAKRSLVAMDREFIWIAGGSQIDRFSKRWRRFDRSYSLPLGGAPLLRLAVDAEEELWAVAENGLYRYERNFDTWKPADY